MLIKLLKNIVSWLVETYLKIVRRIKIFNIDRSTRRKQKIRIMDSLSTIKYIKEQQCSVSRYGDGEINLMLTENDSPKFQRYTDRLSKDLERVFVEKNDALLICVPKCIESRKGLRAKPKKFWDDWVLKNINQFYGLVKDKSRPISFGDSLITRPWMDRQNVKYADKIFCELKTLWRNKELLIVEGEKTRLGVGNDLFDGAKSIKRILAPACNAYDKYEEIISAILDVYQGELVLIALGPTATVLASDLSRKNIWAIDVGHIDIEYEWFKDRKTTKTAVKGKWVNEAKIEMEIGDSSDAIYVSQIIRIVGD